MFQKTGFFILVAGLLMVSLGCKNYSKTLKSGNNELKYETGIDLYEKGDFNRALQFFDILRAVYRGTERGEKLTYYTANSYFQMKDYQIAAYYYKQYNQMYSRGTHAEECGFLSAYCNFLDSPRYSLDQNSTHLALRELQGFIDQYPRSDRVEEATRLMDELRAKLELKDFKVAMLYYKMESYQAAITSFEGLLDDYPDTDNKEEVLFHITKAYYLYAENSIYSKRMERYEKTLESYNNLKYLYPESEYLSKVDKIYDEVKEIVSN